MKSKSFGIGLLAFGAGIASLSCNGAKDSGQTGSPFQEPPEYRSPGRFGPDEPGGGTGNPGGPSIDNNPIWRRLPSDLARLQDDLLLVFNAQRGLLVFDVTTADDPELIGTLPMQPGSYPYALLTEPGAATLVAVEYTDVQSTMLDDEPLATQTQRLIRVDLSDPTQPTRVADTPLGGSFWSLQQHEDQYFALTQLYGETVLVCDAMGLPQYVTDQGPSWKKLQVTQFAFTGAAFSEVATVELPSDGLGFITEYGFAGIPNGYEAEHSLNWLGFDATQTDALGTVATVELPGQVVGVTAREDQVAISVQTDQGGLLKLYDSSVALEEIASLALPQLGPVLEFLPGTDKLTVSGAFGTLLIDVSVPTAPVAETLPNTVQRLLGTDAGPLGIGTVDGMPGNPAVFSLWDVSGAATELASLTTDWPLYGLDSNEYTTWTLSGSTLALPFQRQGERTPALGTVAIGAASLSVSGETRMHGHNLAPLLSGDPVTLAYGIDEYSVEVLPLGDDTPAPTEPTSIVHDLRVPVVRQLTETATHELELRMQPDETREAVFTPKDGSEATVVPLTHHVDELVVMGDWVVAAGLYWNSECQYLEDPANGVPVEDYPGCGPQNQRALSVFTAAGALIETFPITADMDLEDPVAGTETETRWDGFLRLSEERLVFVVERIIRCNSQATCDALGVPAYTSMATPGGMSCANPDECPPVSNEPFEVVSGHKREMLYYVLDVGDDPSLLPPAVADGGVDTVGEGPLDTSARALPFPGGFALTGTEALYNSQGNNLTDANGEALQRFWLHRFQVDDDGAIDVLPAVNTPGRPFALYDDQVWSAEPLYRDAARIAVIHRSRLVNDGAFLESSAEIGAGHISPIQRGDRAFVIEGPADYCAETLESQLFEIDLRTTELPTDSVLSLPMSNWSFDIVQPEVDSDTLYLRGGPLQYSGRLSLDVSERGEPAILEYESINPQAALP
jgi:hypothetical protein